MPAQISLDSTFISYQAVQNLLHKFIKSLSHQNGLSCLYKKCLHCVIVRASTPKSLGKAVKHSRELKTAPVPLSDCHLPKKSEESTAPCNFLTHPLMSKKLDDC